MFPTTNINIRLSIKSITKKSRRLSACGTTFNLHTGLSHYNLDLNGLVSNESPLGKALMGHKVGDRVEIQVSKDYSYFAVIKKIDNSTIDDSGKLRSY